MKTLPRLLITMGDVAGIGPEIIARAWPELTTICRPVVVGDPAWLRWALDLVKALGDVREVRHSSETEPGPDAVPCLKGSDQDLTGVVMGKVSAAAGQAAYD